MEIFPNLEIWQISGILHSGHRKPWVGSCPRTPLSKNSTIVAKILHGHLLFKFYSVVSLDLMSPLFVTPFVEYLLDLPPKNPFDFSSSTLAVLLTFDFYRSWVSSSPAAGTFFKCHYSAWLGLFSSSSPWRTPFFTYYCNPFAKHLRHEKCVKNHFQLINKKLLCLLCF